MHTFLSRRPLLIMAGLTLLLALSGIVATPRAHATDPLSVR